MGGRFRNLNSKMMRGGVKVDKEKEEGSLLDAAKEALVGLLDNMKEGDSFGLVTFCTGPLPPNLLIPPPSYFDDIPTHKK